jgi:formate dehydrogenase maturation protein FdhE
MVDLRYLRIHLTVCRWREVGRCINCETLLTAKDIFGRVRDKY